MSEEVILFGVDSIFSAEVAETVRRLGGSVLAGVMTGPSEWDLRGIERIVEENEISADMLSLSVIVPWITPTKRFERYQRAKVLGFFRFEPVIDPSAVIASNVTISAGTFVNAGVTVGAFAVLGKGTVVNRNASIGHHTVLDKFVSIGPSAAVAARCKIGRGVMIGSGAAIAPGLVLSPGSVIGLNSAVVRDVPEGSIYFGNPGKVKKTGLAILPELDI